MPTKSPGLMSSTEALATPAIFQPGFIISVAFGPSRVFTVSVDPSRPTTVPRTRTFSAACAGDRIAIARNAAAALAPPKAWGNFRFIFELSALAYHNRLLRRPPRSTGPEHRASRDNGRRLHFIRRSRRFRVLQWRSKHAGYPPRPAGEDKACLSAASGLFKRTRLSAALPLCRSACADHLRIAVADHRHFGDPRHRRTRVEIKAESGDLIRVRGVATRVVGRVAVDN